ncbi:hypothetical protein WJX72_003375 [[Myrmecia] bisecta]|uniref:30S ribosomal protein S6 n=1 Tax=[Myrmecia] bisecta TaxID=41462 RepID=A0AAW1Q517_9CHLO
MKDLRGSMPASASLLAGDPVVNGQPPDRPHCPSNRRHYASRVTARAAAAQTADGVALPAGYVWYETMIVMRPDMTDEERDVELAKFEAFLNKSECQHIKALVRGRQRLSYPMKGFWDGIYVMYTYASKRSVSQSVQKLLSTPVVGAENNILRHLTFCS